MSRIFDVYFNDGQDESVDKIALPDGKFRRLQNCRLDRDARLEVRPAYTSLTNTVNRSGTRFRAFDLTTYRNRLIALGTLDSASTTPNHAETLFQYVNNSQSVWSQKVGAELPPLLGVERIWQSPTGLTADMIDIAYTNGQLCIAQSDAANARVTVSRIDVATGVTLATQSFTAAGATIVSARVVAVGNLFILVIRQGNADMSARSFDTSATATSFGGAATLEAGAATGAVRWDLAPLTGTSDFLISYPRPGAGNTRLRRYTTAFAVVNTLDIATVGDSAVIGDSARGVVYALRNGANIELRTCSTALAVTFGPSNVITTAVDQPALAFIASTAVTVIAGSTGTLGDKNCESTVRAIADHSNILTTSILNMTTVSKPLTSQFDFAGSEEVLECWALGLLPAGGNEPSALRFYSCGLCNVDRTTFTCAGQWNYGVSSTMPIDVANNTGGRASIATDGAGNYWAACSVLSGLSVGGTSAGQAQIFKLEVAKTDRRMVAEMHSALYIAGGFPFMFDGSQGAAEVGFLDTPVIDTTVTQSATGSLTLLSTYTYIAMYEYIDGNGYVHRSSPSDPFSVTLTGGNNALAFTVSAPHTLRRLGSVLGSSSVVLYRNTPGDSVFYRVQEAKANNVAFGVVGITDTRSDTDAQTREVLYIYSQKPVVNVAGQPCKYVAAGRDRLIYGGLPDPYMIAFSQLTFPGEPVESASPNNFAFSTRLPEPVTGVAAWGDQYIAFTASAIYQIPGAGPQRNGTGEFFYPQELYADGGCIDWRSIVSCGKGTFFQLAPDKLFILTGQGAQWIGQPVRDQLAAFPIITGACLCSSTQRVVFSCTNAGGSDGVLLVYDLRRDIWTVDNVGAVSAVTEYLGRLAYVQGGVTFLEDASVGLGAAALPTLRADTGSFRLFPSGGYGTLCKVCVPLTYLGDSAIEGFISYDDGKNWTSMGSFAATNAALSNPVTGAGLANGDTYTLVWTPARREVDRFALRFDMSNASNTGGSRFHMVSLEVEANEFLTRQPARNQR